MEKNLRNIRDNFIVDDMTNYWKEKMNFFAEELEKFKESGVRCAVDQNKVVCLYNDDSLSTDEKTKFSNAIEGYLFAEVQFEMVLDLEKEETEQDSSQ